MAGKIVEYGGSTAKAIAEQQPVVIGAARSPQGTVANKIAASASFAPPGVLKQLSASEHEEVRQSVAWNSGTPASVLKELAGDDCPSVRRAVASNRNTPPAALKQLAGDGDESVLRSLAWNEKTPKSVLQEMAKPVEPVMPWDKIAPNDPGHAPYRNSEAVRDVPWAAQLK